MIFPTKNEAILTTAILAAMSGLLAGLLINIGEKDGVKILNGIVTLGAAFLGATVAFSLENKARKRKARITRTGTR
jgi:hypothetical protein